MPSPAVKRLLPSLVVLFVLAPLLLGTASANRGGIPFGFVRYQESAQNALVAWNGQEEILVLSTDLRSDEGGKLLEMLPLPSAPSSISKGDHEQFRTFLRLFNQKLSLYTKPYDRAASMANGGGNGSAVQIIFKTTIGAHDLTVAKVLDAENYTDWVRGFAARNGVSNYTVTHEMHDCVADHLARGMTYFVFDIVDVGPDLKSQDPLVYRFNTTSLYYPMAITAASFGNNGDHYPAVNLFMLVDGEINPDGARFVPMKQGKGFKERIPFNRSELGLISPEIRALFRGGALATHMYTGGGHFVDDNWKTFQDVVITQNDVAWSSASSRWEAQNLVVTPPETPLVTCLMSTILLASVWAVMLFRLKRYW